MKGYWCDTCLFSNCGVPICTCSLRIMRAGHRAASPNFAALFEKSAQLWSAPVGTRQLRTNALRRPAPRKLAGRPVLGHVLALIKMTRLARDNSTNRTEEGSTGQNSVCKKLLVRLGLCKLWDRFAGTVPKTCKRGGSFEHP